MFDKKIKIIISVIVILLLSSILIFVFKAKDKNIENDKSGSGELENKAAEEQVAAKLFEELKNNHPEFSVSQLEFYRETAKRDKAIITPCEARNDVNDCIASVAFLKGESGFCDEIENQEAKIQCAHQKGFEDMDFDKDGLWDKDEAKNRTNPRLADTDNDGLTDYQEVKVYRTDPNNPDTDGDGHTDGDEVKNGYDPLGPGRLNK